MTAMPRVRQIMKTIARKSGLLDWYYLASLRREGPLLEDGWFQSFYQGMCVDRQGNPLPWLTYPALAFLAQRVGGGMRVFEYGCGNGTLWWAAHAGAVRCVEHDRGWYDQIAARVPGNVKLALEEATPDGPYARAVLSDTLPFDIVVIDGYDRVNCARHAVQALSPAGVIIWDDSERSEYEPGFQALAECGFRRLPFAGATPLVSYKSETSLFYRSGNCLDI